MRQPSSYVNSKKYIASAICWCYVCHTNKLTSCLSVHRWWCQRFRERQLRRRNVLPGPTPRRPSHTATHYLPVPSRKQEGESLGQPEPPRHQHLHAFTDHFAAAAIIDGGNPPTGTEFGTQGLGWVGKKKGGERRSWGLVTLPKLNKYKETTEKRK